jgi:hypothetical protein
MRQKFHCAGIGDEAKLSLIVHDLADSEEAIDLAIQFVEETGQTVTVFDAGGRILGFFDVTKH